MNLDLFDSQNKPITLDMDDADVVYFPSFFSRAKSDELFEILQKTIAWRQDNITVFGKTYPQPRLTALYGNNNNPYSYSNITMHPDPFTKNLLFIKKKIEEECNVNFTSCLLNLYRDGQDSNGWHADNEKELGENPVIASVSFGEERWFHFKHKINKDLKQKILLQHGSLLIMQGKTQECWLHQIPKTKKITDPRINLTFRVIR
ncbi:alpha-ketoglutarate-dependent dioxygenase AlkB family protein [Aquimarina celericrescens]|uniref:Alpha-ketoglutarate-dependent dioxygenase AlkB family protein n=1 Tax=Aquimarina celericrescens TaxID=1964542 RepID=A0ABW5AWK8_9FLAO|nr:alpha-ketoglutarate-dependent dioxygenase AlkB [Aquimarina celericrescens]